MDDIELYCYCRGERFVPKVIKNGVCIKKEYISKCYSSAYDKDLRLCEEHMQIENRGKVIPFPNFPEIFYECATDGCTSDVSKDGKKCKNCVRVSNLVKKIYTLESNLKNVCVKYGEQNEQIALEIYKKT